MSDFKPVFSSSTSDDVFDSGVLGMTINSSFRQEAQVIVCTLLTGTPHPNYWIRYGQLADVLKELYACLDQPEAVIAIFIGVMEQAMSLKKSESWIEGEMIFELKANRYSGTRLQYVRNTLTNADGSDASLDAYNERMSRFGRRHFDTLLG